MDNASTNLEKAQKADFRALLARAEKPLLADGAMGTMLHARGAGFHQSFDALNLAEPGRVADIHRAYIEAGAQIILTNTFGANRFKLSEHGLEDQVVAINRAGVELARRVVLASFTEVQVAGDVGPLGVRLAPFGRVQPEQAELAFEQQIRALVEAGVDLVVVETISDLAEIQAAVAAAQRVSDLPLVASMTFTRDDRTLLGDSPARVARALSDAGADVIGVNCSGGPEQILRILKQMRSAVPQAHFSVKPNAGWPEQVAGRIMYPAGPDYFGEYARAFYQAGARIVGGCCGTTPEHVRTMRAALKEAPLEILTSDDTLAARDIEELVAPAVQPSRLAQKLAAGDFVVSVEMDPPRGLSTHKLLAGASLLHEAGADVVNVADSPMARMRMSPWAVCNLIQQEVGIETTLHFPTRGRNLLRVQGDLLAAHALGVRNVFVVMGDPTAIGDYPDAMDNYDLVPSGLIKLIKQGFNLGLDHAGVEIGQPTSFLVGAALNLTPKDLDREVRTLQRKVQAGSDFFLTQPVYEPEKAGELLERYEAAHGRLEVPLLVGVLPLLNHRHAAFLHNEVPGINIPAALQERLQEAGEQAPWEGVRIAQDLIVRMKPFAQGIYLMPAFNRFDLAAEVIESVG